MEETIKAFVEGLREGYEREGLVPERSWRTTSYVQIKGNRTAQGVRAILEDASAWLGAVVDAEKVHPFEDAFVQLIGKIDRLKDDVV